MLDSAFTSSTLGGFSLEMGPSLGSGVGSAEGFAMGFSGGG